MPLFSVIIPHYNSVSLLKQLLESIPLDEEIATLDWHRRPENGSYSQMRMIISWTGLLMSCEGM